MSEKVNLFNYATSELSQDAFIAWLLAWADSKQEGPMHHFGLKFVKYIYDACKMPIPDTTRVEIEEQTDNIDVKCKINGNELILIEDKAGTVQHSDQLKRYLEAMKRSGYFQILPVYIQTRDQSDYSKVYDNGYAVITRRDLLDFFNDNADLQQQAQNQILDDFVEYIKNIERSVQSYKIRALNDWIWDSWIGFYQELQKRLGEGNWSYVANPSGGFLGFWWRWCGNDDGEQYLQLEEQRLCIKICCETKEKSREVMYKYREHFVAEGKKHGFEISRPARLRAGIYTTVAILDGYRKTDVSGRIDMADTVKFLQQFGDFFNNAVSLVND